MKNKLIGITLALMMTAGMITMPAAHAQETAVTDADSQETTMTDLKNQEAAMPAADNQETDTADISDEGTIIDELAAQDSKEAEGTNDAVSETDTDKGTKNELVAPESVENVDAQAKGRGKTKIKWTYVEDADGYYICRASSIGGSYKVCKKITDGEKTKCVDKYKKLRKNKKYYYKVYAYKETNGEVVISETAENDSAKNTLSYKKKIRMKATAYSGGGSCANGKRCKVGRVAVDPKVIPLGTWLYVKGYGFCQACDTGGAIKGKRIDLYFNSESKCSSYGVRTTQVYVLRK